MPNFIPNDVFPDVPSLEDGKPANAAYLNAPHQALVNRTHNLHKTIADGGLTREGATRIREVADEAALKALQGMGDGEVALVRATSLVYRYDASTPTTGVERWLVRPNSGVGRWVNTAFGLVGGAGGLVVLDPDERISGKLGATTVEGPLTIGAGGSIRQRVVMVEPETPGATTYDFACSVERGDVFVAAIPGGSDVPSCKLSDDGAFPGARVRFVRANPGRLSVTDTVASAVLWSKIWAVGDPWNDAAVEFLYVNASVRWVRIY